MEKQVISLAAINPYIESHIVQPCEIDLKGRDFISWGEHNDYPDYLLGLYNSVATLRSIINGSIDYVLGDSIECTLDQFKQKVNGKGETIEQIIRNITKDYYIYGGFALNVIRNRIGEVAEIYYLDFKNIRSDKKNENFYYSEDWGRSFGRVKYLSHPRFSTEGSAPSSIYYYKNIYNQVYPSPLYAASVKACEIEKSINEYHLNSINNAFMGSYIINFNNGKPTDQQKEEIEKNVNEKFGGYQNAGRIVMSFNDTKDAETTITKIDSEDFGAKYESLAKRRRQEIFTAFRAIPALFGIMTETTGFSEQEFSEAFRLYNRTQIKPVQNIIKMAFDTILGEEGTLEIKPFTIE